MPDTRPGVGGVARSRQARYGFGRQLVGWIAAYAFVLHAVFAGIVATQLAVAAKAAGFELCLTDPDGAPAPAHGQASTTTARSIARRRGRSAGARACAARARLSAAADRPCAGSSLLVRAPISSAAPAEAARLRCLPDRVQSRLIGRSPHAGALRQCMEGTMARRIASIHAYSSRCFALRFTRLRASSGRRLEHRRRRTDLHDLGVDARSRPRRGRVPLRVHQVRRARRCRS